MAAICTGPIGPVTRLLGIGRCFVRGAARRGAGHRRAERRGKSTLLKILSRITEPTTGRIELTGRVASLLEVGTGFHPELSGRENIYLNGALLGMTRSEITKHFDEIVAFAEIGEFLDVPVKRYSSGMFVRLAFAVAAHLTSEILIIDEVLAVGDGGFQAKCLGKMRDVGASGRTVLFVSHDLAAVQALCSRAMLLQNGRMVSIGPADEVVGQHVRSMLSNNGDSSALTRQSETDPFVTELTLSDEAGAATSLLPFRATSTLRLKFDVPVAIRGLHFMLRLAGQDGRLKASVTSRKSACTSLADRVITICEFCCRSYRAFPGDIIGTSRFTGRVNEPISLDMTDYARSRFCPGSCPVPVIRMSRDTVNSVWMRRSSSVRKRTTFCRYIQKK